jgi:two-component system, sensor histidine kinase and response regulator
MKPQTILLIDDKAANLAVLSEMLKQQGWEIMAARNGETGLKIAAEGQPDLILLDVQMPDVNGFEICMRLKKLPETKDIPVIFTTILSDLDNKIEGFRLGAVDYIAKPFEEAEVLARVNSHLRLHRLQQDLQAERAALRDKNAELEAFSHTVSHSLKNPLARIESLATTLLQNKGNNASVSAMLSLIQASAQQGRAATEALLKLAEVSQLDVLHTRVAVDVKQAAQKALSDLQTEIQQSGAQIHWRDQSWPPALGYAPWIQEIWRNYLDNALKYSGHPPVLEIGARHTEHYVEYSLQDNGAGLDADTQAQLFQPFMRFEQTRAEGNGLGLSIVRRICVRLGGDAGLVTTPGQGCYFYFRLHSA